MDGMLHPTPLTLKVQCVGVWSFLSRLKKSYNYWHFMNLYILFSITFTITFAIGIAKFSAIVFFAIELNANSFSFLYDKLS